MTASVKSLTSGDPSSTVGTWISIFLPFLGILVVGFGDGADFEGGSVSVVGLRLKRVHWRRSRFTLCSETRSPAQKPAHKDLERNGQARAITLKDTYAPVSNRAGSRSVLKRVHWRSDLRVRASTLNGQSPAI